MMIIMGKLRGKTSPAGLRSGDGGKWLGASLISECFAWTQMGLLIHREAKSDSDFELQVEDRVEKGKGVGVSDRGLT